MELLLKTIEEIKQVDNMYLDKKEVLKRLNEIKKQLSSNQRYAMLVAVGKPKGRQSELDGLLASRKSQIQT